MARDKGARDRGSRGMRDEANVGPDPRAARDLRPMKELDRFVVADGEPDIRGWTVYTSTGREIGVVEDLLVDVDASEVVMLDVDLKRGDRHALAPIRAAWVDRGTKRVVLDAREVAEAQLEAIPGLPRHGVLSDQDVERFNDQYLAAYGDRGYDADRDWRLRHGDEQLRFGRRRDDAERAQLTGDMAAAGAAAASRADERERMEYERRERDRAERELRERETRDRELRERELRDRELRERERRAEARDEMERERAARLRDDRLREERPRDDVPREERVDDARALPDDAAIEPRELDARTRIDEGGHVDDRTPVGGVRYDSPDHPEHDYGRPDERYGPEYGSGRIGFDRVVSRHPSVEADAAEVARRLDEATPEDRRRVRYPSSLEDPADERRRRALEDLDRREQR